MVGTFIRRLAACERDLAFRVRLPVQDVSAALRHDNGGRLDARAITHPSELVSQYMKRKIASLSLANELFVYNATIESPILLRMVHTLCPAEDLGFVEGHLLELFLFKHGHLVGVVGTGGIC